MQIKCSSVFPDGNSSQMQVKCSRMRVKCSGVGKSSQISVKCSGVGNSFLDVG